jgi:hypothetical protein
MCEKCGWEGNNNFDLEGVKQAGFWDEPNPNQKDIATQILCPDCESTVHYHGNNEWVCDNECGWAGDITRMDANLPERFIEGKDPQRIPTGEEMLNALMNREGGFWDEPNPAQEKIESRTCPNCGSLDNAHVPESDMRHPSWLCSNCDQWVIFDTEYDDVTGYKFEKGLESLGDFELPRSEEIRRKAGFWDPKTVDDLGLT